MWKEITDTSDTPRITIVEALGDLSIYGSDEERIAAEGPEGPDGVLLERGSEGFAVALRGDGRLLCPTGSVVTIEQVRGDLDVTGLSGEVHVGIVYRDAALRDVGSASFDQVYGSLKALSVAGELRAQQVAGDARIQGGGGALVLGEINGDLGATGIAGALRIEHVAGSLKAVDIEGEVAANLVHGDALLRGVGAAEIGQVYGSLEATRVTGDLHVDAVHGDARLRQVEGAVSGNRVHGSLKAQGLEGGLTIEHVGGDVRLGPPFTAGAAYRVKAGGTVRVAVPPEASVRLSLGAGGRIRVRVPGLELQREGRQTVGALGAGEATLEAYAGGDVRISPSEAPEEPEPGLDFGPNGMEELGEQISAQVAEAVAGIEAQIARSVPPAGVWQQRVGEAAEQARRAAEQAAEQARMRAERAERRWRRASGQREQPRQEAITNDERLRVLKMVESGKITPQEAATLLTALEGR
ncbi:MAG: hypothetical protein GX601_03355 [Anaerolineales bacterium]|nr:hypothetical protein [Anaerolineales bacterium]